MPQHAGPRPLHLHTVRLERVEAARFTARPPPPWVGVEQHSYVDATLGGGDEAAVALGSDSEYMVMSMLFRAPEMNR